jgi:hypothetical protein
MKLKRIYLGAFILLAVTGLALSVLLRMRVSGAKGKAENESSTVRVCYDLELADPVHPDLSGKKLPVWLSFDQQGFPYEYQLSLQTEVCLERVCKLLKVMLVWDALGHYSRLELPGDDPLTKQNHDPFDSGDYERLDEILKDRESILGTYPLDFFVRPPAESYTDEVDGVTAATPQTVRDAVVSGAAYTSWVLWHWVNGEAADKLRARTLPYCSADYLNHCLRSDDPRFVQFALQRLLKDELYDVRCREACFQILEKGGRANCQLALQYLSAQSLDSDELSVRLIALIGINAGSSRLILDWFENLPDLPPALWVQMAAHLEQVNAYYDVNAVLNLLERRAGDSERVGLEVGKLLQSENRFIVRRAQVFLGKQEER